MAAVQETGLLGGPVDGLQQAAVRLASQICGTPISTVTLIDADRQWFSAVHGLASRESPREHAFCAHTILDQDPLIVCDATKDPRFESNPLVTGAPNIRFYAGVPLLTTSRLPLGTFCVIDSKPRELTAEQLEALRTLAKLVEAQLEMRRQSTSLRQMTERAHRVVDDVSHEFRTPLAVIKEFASIIADGLAGPVTQDQREYLGLMDDAVVDLNHMVEDLLDSSKLRAGRLRVHRRAHNLESIFAACRPAFAHKASARTITVEEHLEPGLPDIFADEEKVRRVIGNLVTNAIKFSGEGTKVELRAFRSTTPGAICVSITDHGPGLSPQDVDQLFGRFKQGSTCRVSSAKGFGLGLSIAQELAWLNLGGLSVESERGKGATFRCTLPECTPQAVLANYFKTIAPADLSGGQVALLRVQAEPGAIPDAAEIEGFLASSTYPTDLVLPESWSTRSRAWWLVGRTRSVTSWINRLSVARSSWIAESSRTLNALEFALRGSWMYPSHADRAIATIETAVCEGRITRAA